MHSTTSGRWEDVIASALLPPPVGGAENPIWSKSVEWRDGARTGRPAPPPRRTSPGRGVLPGTLIGPVPGGRPRPGPSAAGRPPATLSVLVFLLLFPFGSPYQISPLHPLGAPGPCLTDPQHQLLCALLPRPLPVLGAPRSPVCLCAPFISSSPTPPPNQEMSEM